MVDDDDVATTKFDQCRVSHQEEFWPAPQENDFIIFSSPDANKADSPNTPSGESTL
jgi:hypothetical protein